MGKSTSLEVYLTAVSSEKASILDSDDPTVPPILIARIGNGQEIKARCIAKKVRDLGCHILTNSPTLNAKGHRQGTCKMVAVFSGGI